MNKKNIFQLNWRNALGALAIGLGAIAYIELPTTAYPIEDRLQLGGEGVRSRVTPPTPLNLRPRVRIPLPQSNYSRYPRHSYPRSNNSYNGNYPRSHRHHEDYYHHHEHTHRSRSRRRGKVIIISPGNYNGASNSTNGNLIRVIRN